MQDDDTWTSSQFEEMSRHHRWNIPRRETFQVCGRTIDCTY